MQGSFLLFWGNWYIVICWESLWWFFVLLAGTMNTDITGSTAKTKTKTVGLCFQTSVYSCYDTMEFWNRQKNSIQFCYWPPGTQLNREAHVVLDLPFWNQRKLWCKLFSTAFVTQSPLHTKERYIQMFGVMVGCMGRKGGLQPPLTPVIQSYQFWSVRSSEASECSNGQKWEKCLCGFCASTQRAIKR